MEGKRVLNYQVEVHTINRVYVTKVYNRDNYVPYRDLEFEKSFWTIYDQSVRLKDLKEEFPVFIQDKEFFLNPATIEFIEIYKNVNPNKTVKEGIYVLADFPYKTFYQSEKGYFARKLD